jgi:phosphoribosyl 1,2-cyclic phosphodiesterase
VGAEIEVTPELEIRFWGVRGSIPTPLANRLGIGGNTTCLELRRPGCQPVIFDAGTGIHQLGFSLMKEFPKGGDCHIFFTHFHWDHVQGLPFFVPLYRPDWNIRFHSALEGRELEALLCEQMRAPFFPIEFGATLSKRSFCALPDAGIHMDGLAIRHFPLHHPNGVRGYRIDAEGRSIVFATDHEHGQRSLDDGLISMAAGADVLIYDAQYTPEEYESRRGWGHSTAQEGVRMAREAGVKQLVLFHHDPMHDDDAIARILSAAQELFPNTIAGVEGLRICFPAVAGPRP